MRIFALLGIFLILAVAFTSVAGQGMGGMGGKKDKKEDKNEKKEDKKQDKKEEKKQWATTLT